MIKKVLIIDDDPIQFYKIKDWIGSIGFKKDDVIPIDDDINSMEDASNSDPDICAFVEKQIRQNYKDIVLILCDCQFMGDDDRGYVIVKHIRERIKDLAPSNWVSMVPIIGMTKAVSKDKLEELFSAGADYAFEKKCVLNKTRESETIKKFIKTQVDKFEKNLDSIFTSDKASEDENKSEKDEPDKNSRQSQIDLLQEYSNLKDEIDKNKRGEMFENFISNLFFSMGFNEIKKRVKDKSGNETDLIIRNDIDDIFLEKFGKYILVECKNKSEDKVEKNDFIVFQTKLNSTNGLAEIGFMMTTTSFAKTAYLEALRDSKSSQKVFFLDDLLILQLIKADNMLDQLKHIIDDQVKDN